MRLRDLSHLKDVLENVRNFYHQRPVSDGKDIHTVRFPPLTRPAGGAHDFSHTHAHCTVAIQPLQASKQDKILAALIISRHRIILYSIVTISLQI